MSESATAFAKANIVFKRDTVSSLLVHVRLPNGVVLELSSVNAGMLASLMAL